MKEKSILFSGPMVQAILAGRKSQTRRIVKRSRGGSTPCIAQDPAGQTDPNYLGEWMPAGPWPMENTEDGFAPMPCPYGQPGDRLWVRERHQLMDVSPHGYPQCLIGYERKLLIAEPDEGSAPRELSEDEAGLAINHPRWRRSIHMPRWASRITLEVTGVRGQRLNDISEADAEAEGIEPCEMLPNSHWKVYGDGSGSSTRDEVWAYQTLWESINGPGSWAANPWVWVVEFKRLEGGSL